MTNLTGSWVGTLDSPESDRTATVVASFLHANGQLQGTISGKNVYPGDGRESDHDIFSGGVSTETIEFQSVRQSDKAQFSYDGTILPDGKTIRGVWSNLVRSGTFVLVKSDNTPSSDKVSMEDRAISIS